MCPEHRLSMQLKAKECESASPQMFGLFSKILNHKFFDIFDESDAELHPKYELVYAENGPTHLTACETRTIVIQSVLRKLCNHREGSTLTSLLSKSNVATFDKRVQSGFNHLRLLQGKKLDLIRSDIIKQVTQELVNDPPHELRWLKQFQKSFGEKGEKDIVSFITDVTHTHEIPSTVSKFDVNAKEQLLCLRGVLGQGVVMSALEKRHRVDFGVDPSRESGTNPNWLAVPFRGQ